MEQHFYRDDFEQMLKDSTEDFRMYPSRKVWHSIYNDLHPDRKWPSFAVCLLLLVSILYVGVSNNNQISKNARNILNQAGIATTPNLEADLKKLATVPLTKSPGNSAATPDQNAASNIVLTTSNDDRSLASIKYIPVTGISSTQELNHTYHNLPEILPAAFTGSTNLNYPSVAQQNLVIDDASAHLPVRQNLKQTGFDITGDNIAITNKTIGIAPASARVENKSGASITTDLAAISWIEDFAFHNVRNKTKWKTNTSFQYYVTPSLGYRTLKQNNDFEPTTGALLRTNDNEAVTQQAAPGFEAGAQILVGLSKKLRFKAGLQFNYTKYITYAHELQHPSQATVLMNDGDNRFVIPVSYNSYHANVLGSNFNRLSNTTDQISLPLGFDYKLAGKNKIRWYVGSSIQPSYVVSGNAVLISHDSKNFVNDPSVLRTFNVNSSLETFVSFKTPSGIDINVGPQVRYQLLSTYQKEYTYTEKLYNLGIKIGITKKL